jgi:hypothetical protein
MKKVQLTTITYNKTIADREERIVEAWQITKELFVHKYKYKITETVIWTVSHKTGFCLITNLVTKKIAIECINAIKDLIDWDFTEENMPSPDILNKVYSVIKDFK